MERKSKLSEKNAAIKQDQPRKYEKEELAEWNE